MACYFYKNEYNNTVSFISCTWLGHELDLNDTSIDVAMSICHLTVVNSEQDCYKGTVKYKDLDDFRQGIVSLDILNTLIKVGLQGADQYQGDKIAWKTIFNKDDCQMTLIGFLRQALPVHIGTFRLDRVSDSEKLQIWTEWMEKTTSQFKILRETQDALTLRNDYLEKEFKRMEAVAEDLVIQKTSTDLILMAKFKELLNQKKRKIRRLAKQINKVKDIPPCTPRINSPSSSQPKATHTLSEESSPSPVKKPKLNKKEPTNDDKMTMSLDSDSENDDFSKDLPVVTTRSRLRKFAHSKRPSPSKSDHDSDSTTDDGET